MQEGASPGQLPSWASRGGGVNRVCKEMQGSPTLPLCDFRGAMLTLQITWKTRETLAAL